MGEDVREDQWEREFRRVSAEDPQLRAHGRHYSCRFQLDMEVHRVLVVMHRGAIEELRIDPPPLVTTYQFGLRACAETWRKMAESPPPPMYHGIFAANAKRDLRFEGDLLAMMQNLRSFVRHIELLRQTGVPV